jgi:hypothetical protein
MNVPAYDILKKDGVDGSRWVEAVADLEEAKVRARLLAAGAPGEYFVFNQQTGNIVANITGDSEAAK